MSRQMLAPHGSSARKNFMNAYVGSSLMLMVLSGARYSLIRLYVVETPL